MIKNLKKAFTIIELVIVIAVIAILAAVMIPTYSSLVEKANLSADQVAVRNMNTALATDKVTEGTPKSLYEVKMILSDAGYKTDKNMLSPTSKNYSYYWNSETNEIMLVNDESKIVYPETKEYETLVIDKLKHFDLSYPAAKVEETGAKTLKAGTDENNKTLLKYYQSDNITNDLPLACSFVFKATESSTDSSKNDYSDWRCDFTVSFDSDITVTALGQIYLAGQYDGNGKQWEVLDPYGMEEYRNITKGTEIDLLKFMGWGSNDQYFDYQSICTFVKEFNCGAWANDSFKGTTMTVELRLYKPNPNYDKTNAAGSEGGNAKFLTDEYVTVYVYKYTF